MTRGFVLAVFLFISACAGEHEMGVGAWSPATALPFEARTNAVTLWTGSEMVVWGGVGLCGRSATCGDGGRYDSKTDSWRLILPDPIVVGRFGHSLVWSGTDVLMWGGLCGDTGTEPCTAGAKYSPMADRWTTLSGTSPLAPRTFHTAAWTGEGMVVWGGRDATNGAMLADGARYDPSNETWTPTSPISAPYARRYQSAVWTGTEMIIWGGDGGDRLPNDGGRYDPARDRWTPLPVAGAPAGRFHHTAVWSGSEMIIWGGQGCDGGVQVCGDGARYVPATDAWIPISPRGAPTARSGHTAVWTGTHMIVWGGSGASGSLCEVGGIYDPATDSWRPVTSQGQPALRGDHGAVWTGTRMVIWGGFAGEFPVADMAGYTP